LYSSSLSPIDMQVSAFDVLIVGGGLAGLSLACALRDTRLRLGLVEQRPPQRPAGWDARVYAVSPANAAFLREIGAWKHMAAERIAPLHAMQIFGDGGAELDFSAYETGIPELGWILESSLMACELWENAKRQGNLSLCCPAAPQSLAITSEASRADPFQRRHTFGQVAGWRRWKGFMGTRSA
jgi:2-octaprenylphenol hydroxylase